MDPQICQSGLISRKPPHALPEDAMPIDPTLPYDDTNIFARILRGELPCAKVYDDEHVLAFNDIFPQAPDAVGERLHLCGEHQIL